MTKFNLSIVNLAYPRALVALPGSPKRWTAKQINNKQCSPSKDNCFMLWFTLSLMASDLEKKVVIRSFRAELKILQDN